VCAEIKGREKRGAAPPLYERDKDQGATQGVIGPFPKDQAGDERSRRLRATRTFAKGPAGVQTLQMIIIVRVGKSPRFKSRLRLLTVASQDP
jgi:hypothetical protein